MPHIHVSQDRQATLDGVPVGRVRPQPLRMLAALSAARGRPLPKWALHEVVGSEAETANGINVAAVYLRRMFGPDVVRLVSGAGAILGAGWTVTIEAGEAVVVALPSDLAARATKAAEREGVGLPELVALALEEFL